MVVVSERRRARLPGPGGGGKGGRGGLVVEVRGAQLVGLLLAAGGERERERLRERGLGTGTGSGQTDRQTDRRRTGSRLTVVSVYIRKQRAARARGERQSYRGQTINGNLRRAPSVTPCESVID